MPQIRFHYGRRREEKRKDVAPHVFERVRWGEVYIQGKCQIRLN